jgi:8-amino-7-oxononanoate synthase
MINFGSNDYLGRASRASASASGAGSTGSTASPLVCGWTDRHARLAKLIAQLEATESALLFPTGFAACSGTVATLADAGDLIFSDQLNHASLIDGCRWSRATRVVYDHRDPQAIGELLGRRRDQFDRVWIVTDGVFSMDGHVAPLQPLCDLADQFDAFVIVDEAHGTGVLGEHGSGVCEQIGVKDRVPIRIGTLSKAIGSQGGFVAAPQVVIDYLINRCRTLIYSTALAPPSVEAAIEGIEEISRDPAPRLHVQRLAKRLRAALSIHANAIESTVPIIPVMVGPDRRAVTLSQQLAEAGFYVPAIRPPTVPEGAARLRISLSAAHDEAMVDALAAELQQQQPK